MNYTRPNDPDHVDDPLEWLNGSLIFASALSHLLENETGIVVDLQGDMKNPVGDSNKVIVFYKDGKVYIDDFDQDLPTGTICQISTQ